MDNSPLKEIYSITSSETESTSSSMNKINTGKWDNYISKDGELFYADCLLPAILKNVKEVESISKLSCNTPGGSKIITSKNSTSFHDTLIQQKLFTCFLEYKQYYRNFFQEYQSEEEISKISLIILMTSSENQISDDIIFSYPKKESNYILTAKGSFLTLQSIIKNDFKTELLSSCVKLGDKTFHVFYKNVDKFLFIFAVQDDSLVNRFQSISNDFIEYIEFFYLNKIIKQSGNLNHLEGICEILNIDLHTYAKAMNPFFHLTNYLKLSKDTEAKIYDALNEMEAMDYRDWNDEPLISHREFFICGSILYFNSYLIANQLPNAHINRVKHILNFSGILNVIEKNYIQEFILWYEIPVIHANQKYFLAVCTRNNLTIACLLQTTYQMNNLQDQSKTVNPSLFYIEEIQDTLDYLSEKGIRNIAQAALEVKQSEANKQNKTSAKTESSKKNYIDDIKLPTFTTSGHSSHSQTHSEDSINRDEEYSEMDSEWDGFPNSFKSTSEIDKYSDYRKVFKGNELSTLVDAMFKRKGCYITHIIQINYGLGFLISHIENSEEILLSKFKSACEIIHRVLQSSSYSNKNTIALDGTNTSNSHKYLNNVKEHGIHFTICDNLGNQLSFWVIGRLLDIPPGELYVCHQEDIPQNLIEIAFRLMTLSGC